MKVLGVFGERWTAFLGLATKGNDQIEVLQGERSQSFRALIRNIDPGLLHDLDRQGMDCLWLRPGTENLDALRRKAAGESLGHLAAAGIARTEKKNPS